MRAAATRSDPIQPSAQPAGAPASRGRTVVTIHQKPPRTAARPRLPKGRLFFAKALVLPIVAVALVSHHACAEGSLVELLLRTFGYSLLVGGLVGRIWTTAFISGMKSRVLITTGPYSVVRNPLYCFSLLGFVGAGLALASVTLAAALGVVFFLTHWQAILAEEQKLRSLHAERYDAYCHTAPRFVPQPWKWVIPSELPFRPSIFSRAVADGLLVALVFPATQALQWAHLHAILPVWFRLP